MKILSVVLATAFVLGLSGAAQAADLFTPPLFPASSDVLVCEAANVSTATRTVRIQLIDSTGTVVGDTGEFSLPPGTVDGTNAGGITLVQIK